MDPISKETGHAFNLKLAKKCIKPIFTGGRNKLGLNVPKFLPNLCRGIVREEATYETDKNEVFQGTQDDQETIPEVNIVNNSENVAELIDVGNLDPNNNGPSTNSPLNQTNASQNNTLPSLDIEPNIAFAKTSAFYAILFAVIGCVMLLIILIIALKTGPLKKDNNKTDITRQEDNSNTIHNETPGNNEVIIRGLEDRLRELDRQ